ncbi:MAG: hypothetical protein AAB416_02075 [Patescibacteria group bacterium]
MPRSKPIAERQKTVSVPVREYERLKAIEHEFKRGYDIVPMLFPSENLSDYAHGARVKKSLKKAFEEHPPMYGDTPYR